MPVSFAIVSSKSTEVIRHFSLTVVHDMLDFRGLEKIVDRDDGRARFQHSVQGENELGAVLQQDADAVTPAHAVSGLQLRAVPLDVAGQVRVREPVAAPVEADFARLPRHDRIELRNNG